MFVYIFKFKYFYFSMDLKKYAVLSEMRKNSVVLFSTSRMPTSVVKREEGWDLVSKFAHQIGLTDSVLPRLDFRALINRWKSLFRVCGCIDCPLMTYLIHLFPVVLQMKVRREIDHRDGISRVGSDFDMCDECMFELFGVDRETLANKWAKNPFLDVRRSSAKRARLCEPDDDNENNECAEKDGDTISQKELDTSESDALLCELRRAKLSLVREKTKWYKMQNEIAKLDLAQRQSVSAVNPPVAQKERECTSRLLRHDYINKK